MKISLRHCVFLTYVIVFCWINAPLSAHAQLKPICRLQSPDHKTQAEFALLGGRVVYNLQFNNQPVVKWSVLALEIEGSELFKNILTARSERSKHKEIFDWPLGEDARIDNHYNQVVLHCQSASSTAVIMARMYNGSLAFKYICKGFDKTAPVRLKKELTEVNFADTYKIYQYHEESVFRPATLDSLLGTSDLPSTLVSDKKLYVSIGEAENRSYSKCVLVRGKAANSLNFNFYTDTLYRSGQVSAVKKDTLVIFKDSLVTPWRTISCAGTAIGLHACSQLNLKLTTPVTTATPKNIRPGKVFRVPITTRGSLEGIDFAFKNHFQYILLDAGWYGAEFRSTSDPTRPIPGLDLQGIIKHASAKGIGVILYVNYVGLKAKLDTILPLFKSWGVSGLKFGFVDGGTQKGLSWLDTAVSKANDYGFIINIHDHYKPTGLSRRYPYNLSQEGVRGDENSPDAFHTTVLPYTRYLAGPADFTFCYPNSKERFTKNVRVSMAQQLALTIIYFDPLQAIFWYGKSGDYTNEQEIDFFKHVPTVWDESHYIAGEIGKSISVARKKDGTWYLGSAAGFDIWRTSVKLSFLDKKKTYTATVYEDNGIGSIKTTLIKVKRNDQWPFEIAAKGGQAVIIKPD